MNEMMQAAQTSLTKQGENITKLTTLAFVIVTGKQIGRAHV